VIHRTVYYGSRKFFYARDVKNGHLIWRNDEVKIFGGTPIYWNERLYFISKDYTRDFSQLFCLSATNGRLLWKKNMPGDPNIFTPIVHNRKVYISTLNTLYCYNAYNGKRIWVKKHKANIASHTVFANNRLYLSLDNGSISMLEPETGQFIDSFPSYNKKGAHFIIAGETLFITDEKGALYSYQSYEKKLKWKFQSDFTNLRGTLSSANGRVYLAVASHLYSVSPGILPATSYIASSGRDKEKQKEPFEEKKKEVISPASTKQVEKEKISVQLKDSKNNPIKGEITVFQNNKPHKYYTKGGETIIEVEKNREFSMTAEAKEYFSKTVHIESRQKRKSIDITMQRLKKNRTYVFNDINFKYNSAELRESSYQTLKAISRLFKDNPDLKIIIKGHTDNIGGKDFNLKLSQRRADKVKDFLVKNGVKDTRIKAIGMGESKPVASNDTEKGRAKNRRVEFKIK